MNARNIGYWATLGLFSLALLGSGVMALTAQPDMVANYVNLGFPEWFAQWLGFFKIAGVVVLLLPGLGRLKEWAYAGFTINLLSASAAHIMAGDPIGEAIPPLVMLGFALTSWALRPDSRKMAANTDAVAVAAK
ncbi:MAG: DoxX family protein [Myxococcota bacterium]